MLGRALAPVLVAVAVAAGCTTAPTSSSPLPPPTVSVWFAGDSNAGHTSDLMVPRPWHSAVGGSGFTTSALSLVLDNTEAQIAQYGAPETLLVMAGVVDTPHRPTADIIAGMEEFKAAMLAHGVRLIWVAEPAWKFADRVEPLSQWALSQPESIDCRSAAGAADYDGVHPKSFANLARCMDLAVAALGVEFHARVPTP
jgi:hypothetical protein